MIELVKITAAMVDPIHRSKLISPSADWPLSSPHSPPRLRVNSGQAPRRDTASQIETVAKDTGISFHARRGNAVRDAPRRLVFPGVADPEARPLWTRHYEIGSNRPVFAGRDGIKKYALAEIERERRTGTPWYGAWPLILVEAAYPRWRRQVGGISPSRKFD
ncbi:pectate lyase, PelA/Pel-15E family [Singulisphaera sp. GP187]|uniref:pectate lyase n=1 Tax=Singulisphaera sp. GP187 TaxID=1882752 RepID=UPI0009292BB8|nr:pectate lyase [Singulisphaera sp. GP187]SIO39969.1 pectate lyase, PelA/Pel-15E family [Singulisphaera sp. GP187]